MAHKSVRRKSAPRKASYKPYIEEIYVKPSLRGKIRIKLKLDPPVKKALKTRKMYSTQGPC